MAENPSRIHQYYAFTLTEDKYLFVTSNCHPAQYPLDLHPKSAHVRLQLTPIREFFESGDGGVGQGAGWSGPQN